MKEKENKPEETVVANQSATVETPGAETGNPVAGASLLNTVLRHPELAHLLSGLAAGKSFDDAVRTLKIPPEHTEIKQETLNALIHKLNIEEKDKAGFSHALTEAVAGNEEGNIELMAKGLIFEKACSEREHKAYIKGRNEKIELEKEAVFNPFKPIPKPEVKNVPDFYFHTPRKSVWDD